MLDILYLPFWSSLWPSPPCSNCIRPTLTVYINWLVCPLTLAWVQPVESTSRRSKRSRRNYTSGQDEVKEIIFNSLLKKLMNYTNTLKMQYQLLDIRWYRTVIPEREKTSWNLKFPSLLPREFPACSAGSGDLSVLRGWTWETRKAKAAREDSCTERVCSRYLQRVPMESLA